MSAGEAAAIATMVASSILILEFRSKVRTSLPDFWLEVAGESRTDPATRSLTVINCGGSACFRITAQTLANRTVVYATDRLDPGEHETFHMKIPPRETNTSRPFPTVPLIFWSGIVRLGGPPQGFVRISAIRSSGGTTKRLFCVGGGPRGVCLPLGRTRAMILQAWHRWHVRKGGRNAAST